MTVTSPAPASSEFWTSSAAAFRGSFCDRASSRMRSNGSAGFNRTRSDRRGAADDGDMGDMVPPAGPAPKRIEPGAGFR